MLDSIKVITNLPKPILEMKKLIELVEKKRIKEEADGEQTEWEKKYPNHQSSEFEISEMKRSNSFKPY